MSEVELIDYKVVVRGRDYWLVMQTDCGVIEQRIYASDWYEAVSRAEMIVQEFTLQTA